MRQDALMATGRVVSDSRNRWAPLAALLAPKPPWGRYGETGVNLFLIFTTSAVDALYAWTVAWGSLGCVVYVAERAREVVRRRTNL